MPVSLWKGTGFLFFMAAHCIEILVEQRTAGTSSLHAKEIAAECYFLM